MNSADKKWVIGVDEAGYGPNLGPLVVAATAWRIDDQLSESEIIQALADDFPPRRYAVGCTHIPLGDSKVLYQSGKSLDSLEAGLLSLLPADASVSDMVALIRTIHADNLFQDAKAAPWYQEMALARLSVPSSLSKPELDRLSKKANTRLNELGIAVHKTRASVVTESQLNAQLKRDGSKGIVLSVTSLDLVRQLLDDLDGPVAVFCDRQGGRKNYIPLLQQILPDYWFSETRSSRERCSYLNQTGREIEIHFSVAGDSFPPTALASMVAKYTRERIMQCFNAFWQQHVPALEPTAGYPLDAKRFRSAIAGKAAELELPDRLWWRSK